MDSAWVGVIGALGGVVAAGGFDRWRDSARRRQAKEDRFLDLRRELAVRFVDAAKEYLVAAQLATSANFGIRCQGEASR